jgi:Fur family ferric uptake transcriptional regulator
LTASDDNGFAIDEAEVVYWGRCPNCSAETTNTPSRQTANKESDRRV